MKPEWFVETTMTVLWLCKGKWISVPAEVHANGWATITKPNGDSHIVKPGRWRPVEVSTKGETP